MAHRRANPPDPPNTFGAPSAFGPQQHGSPERTVRTADILSLCMVQERRTQTLQAGRHTTLVLQLRLKR